MSTVPRMTAEQARAVARLLQRDKSESAVPETLRLTSPQTKTCRPDAASRGRQAKERR